MEIKEQKNKVVYLPHNHTPQMHKLFLMGIAAVNEVINELELKRREGQEKTSAAAG